MRARYILIGVAFLSALAAQASAQVSEGNKPFVPTRLEWLELYLNAGRGVAYAAEHGYAINYVADPLKDEIVIVVVYHPDQVKEQVMRNAVRTAKQIVAVYAQTHDWPWLKVREEIRSLTGSGPFDTPLPSATLPDADKPSPEPPPEP